MKPKKRTADAPTGANPRRNRVLGTLEHGAPSSDATADGVTAWKIAFAVAELLRITDEADAALRRLDAIAGLGHLSDLIAPYSVGHMRGHHTAIRDLANLQLVPLLATAGALGKQKLTPAKRLARVFTQSFLTLRERAGVGVADRARELGSLDKSATSKARKQRVRDEARKHRGHVSRVKRHALEEEARLREYWIEPARAMKNLHPTLASDIDAFVESLVCDRRAMVLGMTILDGKIAASFSGSRS